MFLIRFLATISLALKLHKSLSELTCTAFQTGWKNSAAPAGSTFSLWQQRPLFHTMTDDLYNMHVIEMHWDQHLSRVCITELWRNCIQEMKRVVTKRGAGGNKWATYIRAKQKGQIDPLLSLLAPAYYKLSVPSTHMRVHTRAQTYTQAQTARTINQAVLSRFGSSSVGKTKRIKRKENKDHIGEEQWVHNGL